MKKIVIVTIGEPAENDGLSDRGLSPNGLYQANEIFISDEWSKLQKPETIFIGKGKAYSETAEALGLQIQPGQITEICGGADLNYRAIQELIGSLDDNSLLIVEPNFVSPTTYNGVLLEVNIDPAKGYDWPLSKTAGDYVVLFSGEPVFNQF